MKTPERPLGLYVHIPFCKQKCAYCDFYSLAGNENRMDAYTDALCADLTEQSQYVGAYRVDTVYFGGGTPSYLGEKRLARILKTILKKYTVAKDAEITLEANPDSATDWKALRALRRAGFNRISLGMQSGRDEELRDIGRIHTAAQTRQAVENCQVFLVKFPFPDLAGKLGGGLTSAGVDHQSADHPVKAVDGADVGVGISQFLPQQLRHSSGFISGQHPGRFYADNDIAIHMDNFHNSLL